MSTDPVDLVKALHSSEEWSRLANIRHFSLSLLIFRVNAGELKKVLQRTEDPNHFIDLMSVRNQPDLERFQHEVVRLLHNFVSSASSLIDHARILHREQYESGGELAEYANQISTRFANFGLAQFVVGLRQFCCHYRAPKIQNRMSYQAERGFEHVVCLRKSDLLEFSGWKSVARTYLMELPEQIDILALVRGYENHVIQFYDWFYARLRTIHEADEKVVLTRQEALRAAFRPHATAALGNSLKFSEDGIGDVWGNIAGIVDPTALRQLIAEHNDDRDGLFRALLMELNKTCDVRDDDANRLGALMQRDWGRR